MGDSDKHQADLEAAAAATPIRLPPMSRPPAASKEEPAYRLYLPRPQSLAVALWIWLLFSGAYVVLGSIALYVAFFVEIEESQAGANAGLFIVDSGNKPWLVFLVGANLIRLVLMAAALRSSQASAWVRLGWTAGLASSLLHCADFLIGFGRGLSSLGILRPSSAPMAAAGVGAAILLLIPGAIKWVWTPPELHFPDWTYGEPSKGPLRRPEEIKEREPEGGI